MKKLLFATVLCSLLAMIAVGCGDGGTEAKSEDVKALPTDKVGAGVKTVSPGGVGTTGGGVTANTGRVSVDGAGK